VLKTWMGNKTHRYYKHTKFCQNPKNDPKLLVDLKWNSPEASLLGHLSGKCLPTRLGNNGAGPPEVHGHINCLELFAATLAIRHL